MLKRILKNMAAQWLAALMKKQLGSVNNDPSKLTLDIRLTNIRKYATCWLKQTLTQLDSPEQRPNVEGVRDAGCPR